MDRKPDVLAFLKESGQASLAQVANHLKVSKQAALRHLEALEQQRLIQVLTGAHNGPGRPGHIYKLTDAGQQAFPSGHRELAQELVAFLDGKALERFFATRSERLERQHQQRLAGLDLSERVREVARLATERGHMSQVSEADGKLLLKHCNCPIGDVAVRTGHACRQELDMYKRLFQAEVERKTWAAGGDSACSYEIVISSEQRSPGPGVNTVG
ncbi:MAG: ArsR family transcriptional regulator [Candidatus Dormibacteraeota bacterium]|nr:ArsR family transcriptional regulator [Candidatus Dormibacteraeota bacterium]